MKHRPASAGGYAGTQVQLHIPTHSLEKKRKAYTHLSLMSPTFYTPVSRGAVEGLQLLPHYHQPLLHVQQIIVQVFMLHGGILALLYLRLRSAAAGGQLGTIKLTYENCNSFLPGELCDSKYCGNKWGWKHFF